jgi:hypothetical protein
MTAEYSAAIREYSSVMTPRGNTLAENTLHSGVLRRKENWHTVCFSLRQGNGRQSTTKFP